jgi:hypothetical protein
VTKQQGHPGIGRFKCRYRIPPGYPKRFHNVLWEGVSSVPIHRIESAEDIGQQRAIYDRGVASHKVRECLSLAGWKTLNGR